MNPKLNLRRFSPLLFLIVTLATIFNTANAQSKSTGQLPGFGAPQGGQSLPGFGRFENALPAVNEQDRAYAQEQITKFDRDKDGSLDRDEVRRTGYKGIESRWFAFDRDDNGKLVARELALSYAKTRVDKERKARSQAAAKLRASRISVSSADKSNAANYIARFDRNSDRKLSKTELSAGWGGNASKMLSSYDLNRSGYLGSTELSRFVAAERAKSEEQQKLMQQQFGMVSFGGAYGRRTRSKPKKASTMASSELLRRYDVNGNGQFDQNEWRLVGGAIGMADNDRNGVVTVAELTAWLEATQTSSNSSTPSTDWFGKRDVNRDGQVTMQEYTDKWTEELLVEFREYDGNRDGVITRAESGMRRTRDGQRYSSRQATVIESGVGASSTILLNEDFVIADLDIEMSISHRACADLDIILIGPDGRRVELFSGAGNKWTSGDFKTTRLDDESSSPIEKAKPPFQGRFKPKSSESAEKTRLADYYGKRSKGVWRLLIRADRSNQHGLLQGWSLVLTPQPPGSRLEPN